MQGPFITLEGVDGAGKSSHLDWLATWFRMQGRVVRMTREPGGTPVGEKLREIVLHEPMHAETEALIMFAARREHIEQVIRPALAAGDVVISDRFTDASFAYQGGGRGFDLALLAQLEHWVQQGRQPDLTLWLDLPARTAALRRQAARAPDRFETQDLAFFERVIAGYEARRSASPGRFAKLDATAPVAAVWQQIIAELERRAWC